MDATNKTKVEKRIVLLLLVIFAVTLAMGPLRSMLSSNKSAPFPKAHVKTQETNITDRVEAERPIKPSKAVIPAGNAYTAQELRDPLKSLLPAPKEPVSEVSNNLAMPAKPAVELNPPKLALQGLLWGSAPPKAIIDDQVYGIGDTVSGAKIIAIDRDGITVEFAGKTMLVAREKNSPDKRAISAAYPLKRRR